MGEVKYRPYSAAIVGIGFPFTIYLYLKISGQIPGEGWVLWNTVDAIIMGILHFLLWVIPICVAAYIIYDTAIVQILRDEEIESIKKQLELELNRSKKYKKQLENFKNEVIEYYQERFYEIESKLEMLSPKVGEELPEAIVQVEKNSSEINNSALQNFL